MLNKIFKDYTTYQKVVKWFNANKYVSEIQGLNLIDYPINKVINIQSTDGKIWAIAIIDDKVSYFIIEDEVIEDDKLDKLINFKLIKNINKSEVLKNIDMKGIKQMKNLYNETVKNNNIEEVEEVTNEQKALQMIKNETIEGTIKYGVIEWVESMMDGYSNIDDIFNDLFTGGCESGIVTDLIYYDDTVAFYNKYEHEINIFLSEATNLFELNTQDKNMLAWASFEHEASLLYDEYLDVLNELYKEEL